MNAWPDSSISKNFWMKLSGCRFKFHWGQLFITTSKYPSVVNTICFSSFHYTHVITCAKFQLKLMWLLMKEIAKMKSKCWTKDEIRVVVQSWLWLRVEVMAWWFNQLQHLNGIRWCWVQIPIQANSYCSYTSKNPSEECFFTVY